MCKRGNDRPGLSQCDLGAGEEKRIIRNEGPNGNGYRITHSDRQQRYEHKEAFCKNAQLTRSVISGFGMCSQRAGAKIGAGPDLYTACKVVNSHPDPACQFAKPVWVCPACQVPNHTGMHCLLSSKYGWQCTARQVVKAWQAVTLTAKTVNVF